MERKYLKHPTPFTYLGFYFNSLVDMGKTESITEIKAKLESNTLFSWLESKYPDDIDVSLFTKEQLKEIEDYFNGLAETMDEERKMGISNNGLCLLVGYCFEAAQVKAEVLHPPMKELYGLK